MVGVLVNADFVERVDGVGVERLVVFNEPLVCVVVKVADVEVADVAPVETHAAVGNEEDKCLDGKHGIHNDEGHNGLVHTRTSKDNHHHSLAKNKQIQGNHSKGIANKVETAGFDSSCKYKYHECIRRIISRPK